MAEQSKPNTFTGGMTTDLDPSYQSKDSYFTGLNIRVVTNGDNSYSLENIKGTTLSNEFNKGVSGSIFTGTNKYKVHGAVVIKDYIITIEADTNASKNWRIRKYEISNNGAMLVSGSDIDAYLWSGLNLFSDNAGEIKIEFLAETDNVHRIYCTDGITGLKTANVKADISSYDISDFQVFKPATLVKVVLSDYNQFGGNLSYGSYSYTYRLSSSGGSTQTDWAPISKTINVVKNDITSNSSLGVEGGSSLENSSASIELTIGNISTDYESIEIASIYYGALNTPVINVIEKGFISGSNYSFQHSGFETTTLVEGGIAAAIINNSSWNVCKSLAKKDNKLYASNLKSETLDIDSQISALLPLKSYKGVSGGGGWSLSSDYTGANPHRHFNGGSSNWSWDVNTNDRLYYKFINKNFQTGTATNISQNPIYVLGAESAGFSGGGFGFRMTFTHQDYLIDDDLNRSPNGSSDSASEQVATELHFTGTGSNDSNYLGAAKGPHNPKWDNAFTSFKRGECYRFGIVFYDLQGIPGFTHHLGDIKMPDALDPNGLVLSSSGTSAQNKSYHNDNSRWSPFSTPISGTSSVTAHALIPRLEVNLSANVKAKISGYKIVRAELSENDKTIITQGILSTTELHHSSESGNTFLAGKTGAQTVPYYVTQQDAGATTNPNAYPIRIADKQYIIETPEVTLGNKVYNLNTGFKIKPLYPVKQNILNTSSGYTYSYSGYKVQTDPDSPNNYGGLHVHKYAPHPALLDSSISVSTNSLWQTPSHEPLCRWVRDIYIGKTVVSGEEIAGSVSNLNRTYRHDTGQYDDSSPNQYSGTAYTGSSSDDEGVGGIRPKFFDQESRAKWTGGAMTGLYISTTSNAPLLGHIRDATTDPATEKSFSDITANFAAATSLEEGNSSKQLKFIPYKWVVEVIRNTSGGGFEQYGGYSDNAIKNTRFIDCSGHQSSTSESLLINGGDTYCDWYTYKNSFDPSDGPASLNWGTCVPLESSINIALRSGIYLGSSEKTFCNVQDNYLYNTAYSQQNNLVGSVVKPSYWSSLDVFTNKVAASNAKVFGEIKDSWSSFPINDFIELNLSQGIITDLINFKNQLFAIQESGVSILSVNSRALIQGEGAAADIQIVTGTGTAIERFDYLSTEYGSQHFNKSIITPTGFYLFDKDKSEIIKSDGQSITALALSNNYKSFIEGITRNKLITISSNNNLGDLVGGIQSAYDFEFRECLFTIRDTSNVKTSFSLSDLTGKLTSKLILSYEENHVFYPKKYIQYNNFLFCIGSENESGTAVDQFHLMNSGLYQNFNFGYVVNDNPTINKIFDTSEIIAMQNEVAGFGSSVSFSSHELSDSTRSNASSASNERVREGIHRVSLRSASSNRARGSWLKHTVFFNQPLQANKITGVANRKFDIFAINTRYRQSR